MLLLLLLLLFKGLGAWGGLMHELTDSGWNLLVDRLTLNFLIKKHCKAHFNIFINGNYYIRNLFYTNAKLLLFHESTYMQIMFAVAGEWSIQNSSGIQYRQFVFFFLEGDFFFELNDCKSPTHFIVTEVIYNSKYLYIKCRRDHLK